MPSLVAEESPWLDFLQSWTTHQPKRLKNWPCIGSIGATCLVPIDGYLRLNQTGTGALTLDDIALLRTGFMVQLVHAEHGPVSIVDMSKIERVDPRTKARLTYYHVYIFRHQERIRTTAFTIIYIVNSKPRPVIHLGLDSWQAQLRAIPIRVQRALVLQAYEGPGKEILLETLAFQQARIVEYKSGGTQRLPLLAAHSNAQLLGLVTGRGIPRLMCTSGCGRDL